MGDQRRSKPGRPKGSGVYGGREGGPRVSFRLRPEQAAAYQHAAERAAKERSSWARDELDQVAAAQVLQDADVVAPEVVEWARRVIGWAPE